MKGIREFSLGYEDRHKLSDVNTLTDENRNLKEKMKVLESRIKTLEMELENEKNKKKYIKKPLELKLEESGETIKPPAQQQVESKPASIYYKCIETL
jgi:hypothetical protein